MLNIRIKHGFALAALPLLILPAALVAQAPAVARQLGTVKSIDGKTIVLTTAAGADVTVTLSPQAPVLQLPPGSKDLKEATPAAFEDIAVGDRILASGAAGDAPATLTASRVILMKSNDIAARNAVEQREWQHGLGGLVRTVDGGTITVVSGAKVLKVETTPSTVVKRYAPDSISFADVQPSSLTDIRPGDQIRARGTVAEDRTSVTADQIVTGTFENLSGAISSVDVTAQTLTLKDLTTKKTVTVYVTQKSDLRNLPAQQAAAFAMRNRPAGASPGASTASSGAPAGTGQQRPAGAGGEAGVGRPRSASGDLSQMLSRLPTQKLSDLHSGQAVMIVASPGTGGKPTAITLLSGVEQILSATPSGQAPLTLSPWNIGEPEGAGGGGESGGGGAAAPSPGK